MEWAGTSEWKLLFIEAFVSVILDDVIRYLWCFFFGLISDRYQNWIGTAPVISQPIFLLSIRKMHLTPLLPLVPLHSSLGCPVGWCASLQLCVGCLMVLCSDSVSISILTQYKPLFLIFQMGSTHGRSTVAKGNRSFWCLLSNQRGRHTDTISLRNNNLARCNNCGKTHCVIEQPSTLVMQRLNFERQSVCGSATGVFLSTSDLK